MIEISQWHIIQGGQGLAALLMCSLNVTHPEYYVRLVIAYPLEFLCPACFAPHSEYKP